MQLTPPKCNAVEKKNLGLLNHIAVLLVAKTRGDVAAVTMEISTSAINFYYAKNGPCDPSIQVYVDRILTVLRENILNAIPKSVLMIVMVECVDKVGDRIRKCQKADLRDRYYYKTPPYSCHSFADTVIGLGEALIRYPTLRPRI